MTQKKKQKAAPVVDRADEAEKIQQRIFEREVDEELRQEKLLNLWKKYRFIVYGAVLAVILGTLGAEWYQSWQTKIRLSESDRYEDAVILAIQGKDDEAITILEQLAQDGKTGHRYLAKMQVVGLLLKTDKEKGLSYLKSLVDDPKAPEALRQAALLSYIGNRADTVDVATLQAELEPMLSDPQNGFYGAAAELAVLLYLRADQPKQAEALLNTVLQNQNLDPTIRERLAALKDTL